MFDVCLISNDSYAKFQSLASPFFYCEYAKRTGIKATMFVSRPGQGATILKG